jgi:hypothetical protein
MNTLTQAQLHIQALDLSTIANNLVKQGWTRRQADSACQLYKNFLLLNVKYGPDSGLAPSQEIDEIWHSHILDTAHYMQDCQNIFGYYLHHAVVEQESIPVTDEQAFAKTQRLYLQEFGMYIQAIRPHILQRVCHKYLMQLKNWFSKHRLLTT